MGQHRPIIHTTHRVHLVLLPTRLYNSMGIKTSFTRDHAQAWREMSEHRAQSAQRVIYLRMEETFSRQEDGGRHLGQVDSKESHHCLKVR